MFLQTLNIEWGQIDPKDKRRVKFPGWSVCWLSSYTHTHTHTVLSWHS